ncbi:hypothetical protein K9N68_02455 [Kovacikia minuta CCNUW1]|uniref:hypothetical protein n=1 Tax=Kovacikia minuta TaxID=2931930 RepID=UPI001CCEFDEA|nr:hypothetical protein [Kovacikia minuta]UBF26870.1 hypothetical protein K9N68_02455 [Kovacikia minuta CCNUW1]
MKLETEFRLCLERQKLEWAFRAPCEVFPSQENYIPPQKFTASSWVKLVELPSPFCADEALLLCQCSESQWLAWLPDYGEILLEVDQFTEQ